MRNLLNAYSPHLLCKMRIQWSIDESVECAEREKQVLHQISSKIRTRQGQMMREA